MHKYILFICVLIVIVACTITSVSAQSTVTITEGSNYVVPCSTMCFTLHATHTQPAHTDIYTAIPIPYSPNILPAPIILNLPDDTFSNAIPIGFSFCYFANSFTNVYVSANGIITFNNLFANNACSFTTTQSLPYTSSTFPDDAICAPFSDMKVNTNSLIRYQTIGNAPNRKFVIQYIQMPLFGTNCGAGSNTFEVVLLESSNKIQMHITSKVTCNNNTSYYANYATLGIQGGSPLAQKTITGRNASIWTATNDSWEFKPIGNANYKIKWINTDSGYVINNNADVISYCATAFPVHIKAALTLKCGDDSAIANITIDTGHAFINNVMITNPVCKYDCNGSITIKTNSTYLPMRYGLSHAYNGLYGFGYDSIFNNQCRDSVFVHIKDSYGCRHDSVFFLNSLSNLGVILYKSPPATCWLANGGMSASNYGGVGAISYLWSNGSTASSIFGYTANTFFSVTAKDSLNCISTESGLITSNIPMPVIDSIHLPECYDSSGYISLSAIGGFGAPYTYLWSTGETTNYLNNMIPFVEYIVYIQDAMGCVGTHIIKLKPINLPFINNAFVTKPTCSYENGSIGAYGYNGTPPYKYLWNTGDTTSTITNLGAGWYIATLIDSKQCPSSDTLKIYLIDTLQMQLHDTAIATTCALNNGKGIVLGYNGMAPYKYIWSNGATASTIVGLPPGSYVCAVSDSLNCLDTANILILPSLPLLLSAIPKNANCDSANGGINAVPANGTAPVLYSWSNATNANPVLNLLPGVYNCIATDANGCTSFVNVSLIDEGSPSIYVIDYSPPLCFGAPQGIATLGGFGGNAPYKYSTDGVNYVPNPIVNQIQAGTYVLYIKDANSCIRDTTLYFVDATQINYTSLPIDTLICFTDRLDSIIINATGGLGLKLFNFDSAGYNTSNIFTNVCLGNHVFGIKDSVGCERWFAFTVIGPPDTLTSTTARYDVPCYEKNTGFLHPIASGGWTPYRYIWADSVYVPNRDNLPIGKYYLYITDNRGCKIESPEVILSDKCCELFVPNAFTPNGDTYNDALELKNRGTISDLLLIVYDRWGQKIFTSNDITQSWNGSFKGTPLAMDTYFYSLRYKCAYLEQYILQNGEVILMR